MTHLAENPVRILLGGRKEATLLLLSSRGTWLLTSQADLLDSCAAVHRQQQEALGEPPALPALFIHAGSVIQGK